MHAIRITLKDLRLLARDRRALIVLLALPLVLISVIGGSAGNLFTGGEPSDTPKHRLGMQESATDPGTTEIQENNEVDGSDSNSPVRGVYRAIIPGFTVLFVFFLVNIMGRSFIQERELGTLQRIRIAPVSPLSIMIGKTLPFLLVSVVQTAILLTAGVFVFGMDPGTRPWLFVPLVFCTSLAAATLGLAFAAFVRTDAQVSAWGNLIVLATSGISGCLIPRHLMPESAQTISLITPHAWSLMAYRELLREPSPQLAVVLNACGLLILFSMVFCVIGLIGFRRGAVR